VGGLENVSLYNIDALEAMARQGVRNREQQLAACHRIIDAHVTALVEKLNLEAERKATRAAARESAKATVAKTRSRHATGPHGTTARHRLERKPIATTNQFERRSRKRKTKVEISPINPLLKKCCTNLSI
jgi:glutamyl-tRNA reductase